MLFGLVVGSFANVCVYRIPRGLSIVTPPSRCPRCERLIAAYDNIPVLSYLWLGGRCRACRERISPRYPLVEAANGLLYLALAHLYGPTWRTPITMAFVTALLVLSLIDADVMLLPDVITLPGIAIGLAASFLPNAQPTPIVAAASALGGWAALAFVATLYKHSRGVDGLGEGDWKLAAMLGAFLGWEKMLLTILIATTVASCWGLLSIWRRGKTMKDPLPLGTFLGWAGILVVLVGAEIIYWYKGLLYV
jgi:leader peptidase (prepilin peptidase)/N-methyltransferase